MALRINNETVTMCSRLSYRPGPCSGQHDRSRTISSPNQRSTKSRIALMAAAIGAVSTAGVGGATAATLQAPAEVEAPVSPEAATVEVDLATNDTALSSSGTQAAPQILAISEFKPVANIDEQLDKAIQYNAERAENCLLYTSDAADD